jgi:phage terminase small subunit
MIVKTELSEKQTRFVQEYLVDQNGTKAAIRSGYSPKTADQQASRLLTKVKIKALLKEKTQAIATKTETDSEWVRRRLKEEADDVGLFATHAGRIRALELIGKINGVFEVDNRQKSLGEDLPRDVLKAIRDRLNVLAFKH